MPDTAALHTETQGWRAACSYLAQNLLCTLIKPVRHHDTYALKNQCLAAQPTFML